MVDAGRRSPLTHVVVLVVWSMKKGRPLGALRTSQPVGMHPAYSKVCVCALGDWCGPGECRGAGECRGEASGDIRGGA